MKHTLFNINKWLNTFLCLVIVSLAVISNPLWAQETGDVNRGAKSWANTCARCHNIRDASEFRDDLWQPIVAHMRIRAGIPGSMARDILAFLQTSNYASGNGASSAESGLSGMEIFSNICVACHGVDGRGALPGVPDLEERLGLDDVTLLQHIVKGYQSPGSTMAMPPRGGTNLSDMDLKKALDYIRQKFR